MSATAILVALIIALLAALLRTAILGAWEVRRMVADFFFALAIILLPGVIRP